MDKFGIFNLLNSFLTLSKGKNSTDEQNSSASSAPADFLGSLLSSATSTAEKPQEPKKETHAQKPSTPLQRQMLATMQTHDQIIKRVNDKTKL